ncbi:nek kinase, partial [Cystoisospora suis]
KEEKRRRERQKESDIYHESREAEEEDSGRFRRNRFRQQEDTPGRRIQTDSCLSGVCTPEEDDQHQASSSTSAVPSSSSLSSSSFSSSTSYSSVLLRSSPSSSSSLLLIPPPRLSGVGDEMPRSFPFERRETEKETSLEKVKIVFNPMLMKAVVYISQLCSYVSFCRTKQALDFFFSFISHFILTLRVLLGRKRKNEKEEGQGKTMKTMKKNEREGHHGDGRTGSKEEVARKRQKTEVQEKEDTEGEESSRRQRGGGGEEEWEVSILLKFIDLVWRKSIALQVTDSRVLCFLHDRAPFFPLVIFHPSTCDHQLSVVTEKILDHSVSISLSESSSSCKISLPLYFLNSPHFTASLPAFSSSSFSPSVRRKASFFQRRDDSKEKILKAANKILCTKRQKTSISPFAHKRWRGDSHDSEYSQFRGESESCFSSTPSPSSASMCRHTGTEDEEEEESRTKKRRPTETSKEKTTGRGHLKRENSSEGVLKRRREREGVDTLG